MDKLFSAGKDFLEKQAQGQGQTGEKKTHGDGARRNDDDGDGLGNAHEEASRLAGSSGNSQLFSQILGNITQRKGQIADGDIDEEDAVRKHEQTYKEDSGRGDENSLGVAAAMQALKVFNNQGGGGGSGSSQTKGGQGAFLALAMSEASKLFDDKAAKGKLPDGASKESIVQKAGEMAMKMYLKSQGQQQGGLLGMASKFIK